MAQRAKMSKRTRWLMIGIGSVLVIAAGVTVFALTRPASTSVSVRTTTATVTRATEVVSLGLSGTLAPVSEADLSFSSAGTVTSVKVQVGQKVKKNQVLAEIDDTDLRNAVDLAAANLTAARTALSDAIDNDASTAQLNSARAQVRSAKASLASAQSALKKARLRSPIDGVIALVNIAKGDTVSGAGSSTTGSGSTGSNSSASASTGADLVVVSTKSWKVNATVGAADVGSLRRGQKATVAVTGTTTTLKATVDTVGIVSTSSGGSASFPVTLKVSGTGTGVYSGVAVTATVAVGTYPDVLTVPTAAIINADGRTAVLQNKNGQQVTTPVVTGRVFGNATEITSGLAEGDEVLIQSRFAGSGTSSGGIRIGVGGGPGGGVPPQDGNGGAGR